MGTRRPAIALAAAALVHGSLAALLPARAPHHVRDEKGRAVASAEDELAIDTEPPPNASAASASVSAPLALRRERAAAPHASAYVAAAEPTSVEDPGASSARRPDAAPGDWTFRTTALAPGALGVGEHTGALARVSGVAITREERAAGQPVTQLGDDADRAAGHARGNPLRDAIEQAARSTDAPTEGFALFEITIGPQQPAKVRLLEGSSDRAGWSRILGAATLAARARSVRLPPDGRGLRVVVRVDASLRLPDGRSQADLGVHVDDRGLEYHESAGPDAPKITLPSKTLRLGGKVCSLSLTTDLSKFPISGGCNPDAIGTHLARRVTATIASEERVSLAAE